MWEQLAEPWQGCIEEAWAAYCAGSMPIGAVIVDAAGEIVARGRNRMYEWSDDERGVCGSRVAHAEINALALFDVRWPDPHTFTLYSSMEPCPMCIGAARMCQIGTVRYATRDAMGGSAHFVGASPFMQRRSVAVFGPESPDLETRLLAIQSEWMLQGIKPQVELILEAWSEVCPAGVELGRQIFASGLLRSLAHDRVSAAVVVDSLASFI